MGIDAMKRNNIHDIVLPEPGMLIGILVGAACQIPSVLLLWSAFNTDMYGGMFIIFFVMPISVIGGLILQISLARSFRKKEQGRAALGIWLL